MNYRDKLILLVEDEAIIAIAQKKTLEKHGYKVITANSGEKAIDVFANDKTIDLVLMDIDLGAGLDGSETAIRMLENRDIPVVFLSSHTEPEVVEKTEKITSYGYVVKNSGITVLDASIKMAFKLFEAKVNENIKEEALRESKEIFSRLFDVEPDAIFIVDSDTGEFIDANPAAQRMYGFTHEEFIRLKVVDISNEPEKSVQSIINRDRHIMERCHRKKDGTEFFVEININYFNMNNREIHVSAVRDITERREMEDILKQNLDNLNKRNKELRCIYQISEIVRRDNISRREIFESAVKIISEAYQYPEITACRIIINDEKYDTVNFIETPWLQVSEISIHGRTAGKVEVCYLEEKPAEFDGPFLKDERKLLDAVAELIGKSTERKIGEEELKKAFLFQQRLVDAIPSPVFYKGVDLRYIGGNKAFERYIGFSKEEFIGKTVYEIAPPDLAEIYDKSDRALLANPGIQEYESRVVYADGTIHDVIFHKSTFTDSNSNTAGLIGFIIDITDRKKIERSLQESEATYHGYVENAPYGVFVTDERGHFLDVNRAAIRISGFAKEELLQLSIYEITEEDKTNNFRTLLDTGNFKGELISRHKDGSLRWWFVDARKISDQRFIGFVRDITYRKLIEDKIKSKNENLEDMIKKFEEYDSSAAQLLKLEAEFLKKQNLLNKTGQMAKVGGWELDTETMEQIWSESLFGIFETESDFILTMENVILFYTPESRPVFEAALKQAIENGKPFNLELELITAKGNRRWIHAIGEAHIEGNKTKLVSVIFQDISENKISKMRIESSQSLLRSIVNSPKDIIIFSLDRNYCYTAFNENHRREMKTVWDADISIGMSILDCMHIPELRALAKLSMDRALNGESFTEIQHQPDPDIFYEFDWNPIFHNGTITGLTVFVRNITEKKHAEEMLKRYSRELKERNKELNSLYTISDIVRSDIPQQEMLKEISTVLAQSYQYPEITACRITLSDVTGSTCNFIKSEWIQTAGISINEKESGLIEVCYLEERPVLFEGPFLTEERRFIDAVAELIGRVVSRKNTEKMLELEEVRIKEKELILQEVNHRVKNFMNTIRGLLLLQADSQDNPPVKAALNETIDRIQNMSLLYDKLFKSCDNAGIPVNGYLTSLADDVIANFPNSKIVKIEKKIDDFVMDVKIMQPVGIIINELLTNIMKYAFTGRTSGLIKLSFRNSGSRCLLEIADNGVGIPDSVSFENSSGFGMQLVRMLAEQIGGSIKIERDAGTKIIMEFDIKE